MIDDVDTIGDRVLFARRARAMTQRELAAAVGRDGKHISQIERGIFRQPRPATVKALAAALDVSLVWLATGYGDMLARDEG